MHVLITGHTGFKGAWASALLSSLGHQVSGISLTPEQGGAFDSAALEDIFVEHSICDIREQDAVATLIARINPDAVIHMAAQPLVIEGYRDPATTMATNVIGTLNVLEACKLATNVKAVLTVTTDKVYRDDGVGNYSEGDALGGHDPYSASKSMADLLAQTYGNLGLPFKIGVARAGNVIGLGDVSANRLLPDITRSFLNGELLTIRQPNAVRPWQHVLDCVNGYVLFLNHLLSDFAKSSSTQILNFGPEPSSYKTVGEVVDMAREILGNLPIEVVSAIVKETQFLTLNSRKAREILNWNDKLDFERAVRWSLEALDKGLDRSLLESQVNRFLAL
jgi:CDP-glucose 4,6-dehydratase